MMKRLWIVLVCLPLMAFSFPDAKVDDEVTVKCERLYTSEMIKMRSELSKLQDKVKRQKDRIEMFKDKANDLDGIELLRFLEDPDYDVVLTSDGKDIWAGSLTVSSTASSLSLEAH